MTNYLESKMNFEEFLQWVKQSLQEQGYRNIEVDLSGGKNITDGFLSDIIFIKVNCELENNQNVTLQLAVKKGVENIVVRKELEIESLFNQEIVFYEKIFPIFLEIQIQKNRVNIFNPFAKYYKSLINNGNELLMMENIKAKGFELSERCKPLSLRHVKMALETFGKFHAFSFVLNDQNPELFASITNDLKDTLIQHFDRSSLPYRQMQELHKHNLELFLRRNENDVYNKMHSFMNNENIVDHVLDIMEEKTLYSVINHGDSWINNLMFQHQVNLKNTLKLTR